jgi:NAD-dependent SIR2 family protein deacetylase
VQALEPIADAARHEALIHFVGRHRRLLLLTGAGCSTASGIGDYRDTEGRWKRAQPMIFQTFVNNANARARYWARSLIGWPVIATARPNAAHFALAALEQRGSTVGLVTQNVDGLHEAAGSQAVIPLHGRLADVVCLQCGQKEPRSAFQAELSMLNPGWAELPALAAPDGDADLEGVDFSEFHVPNCLRCGGMLKPDVVFFGENVPKDRVSAVVQLLDRADSMLVVGSSLMVWSGYRFVARAAQQGLPIACINRGRTRADQMFMLKDERPCADALRFLLATRGIS